MFKNRSFCPLEILTNAVDCHIRPIHGRQSIEINMVILGVIFHAIDGFAAGSFYLPLKQIKQWAWESGWIVNGFFSWIIAPLLVALLTVPDLFGAILSAPPATGRVLMI